jgi:hypothetical protein
MRRPETFPLCRDRGTIRVTVTKIVELEVTGGRRFIPPRATYDAVLPVG